MNHKHHHGETETKEREREQRRRKMTDHQQPPPPPSSSSNVHQDTNFSKVHVYDNNATDVIQNDWGRDPFFWATPKVFIREILNAKVVENTNETVWEIEDRRIHDGKKAKGDEEQKKIRRIRKCELCGVIVEFTTRKDSKIFLTLDDGTGLIECVIWEPSTMTALRSSSSISGNNVFDEEEENYNLNRVEQDRFGRIVADDGVLLLHGRLRLGETVFVQGRVCVYNGTKQVVVNSIQMICEREGLARERDLESLFWLDVVEQRMDKG